MVFDVFKCEIFPLPPTADTRLKILTPIQMLRRLPIALGQLKVGSTNLANHIFFVSANEFTKKVYNNIMNSIQL